MERNEEEQILEKMLQIAELIQQSEQGKDMQLGDINYYKSLKFEGIKSNWEENNIYVATLENTKDNTKGYEIYSGTTNSLIATVDSQGKLEFMQGYIENVSNRLNGMDKNLVEKIIEMLKSGSVEFIPPQQLERDDRVLTKEEREHVEKEKASSKTKQKDDKEDTEQEEQEETRKPEEEQEKENIAKKKGVPTHNVLVVRENSNLYKDHPNLEPNLYFYRGNDGAVKAEYLDSNGEPQESKYFEASTTSLRQETVSLGDDGKPVTKEVPYQVMRTKGLNNVDKDIRDIRITINIDVYGYLEISEARQGKNGEWLSHDIEVKGRNYNSHAVNRATSIGTRRADPDQQIDAYEQVEDTALADDGIDYSEMYLIGHSEEVINELIKEGYQKKEAVQIIDYVIGEEKLTFKEAKEKVNKEIDKESKENTKETNDFMDDDEENNGGRTQGGDAWEERERRGM